MSIAAERARRDKTQQELADACGMNRMDVYLIERRGALPTHRQALAIAKFLRVPLKALFAEDEIARMI